MIDRLALQDDLIRGFCQYQYRLDIPMPSPTESPKTYELAFMTDPIFRAKVKSLVAGTMHIMDKHIVSIN